MAFALENEIKQEWKSQ
jgi:hypothetical protein